MHKFKRVFYYHFLLLMEKLFDIRFRIHLIHQNYFKKPGRIVFISSGILSVATLIMEFGFYYPATWTPFIKLINSAIIYFLLIHEITNFLLTTLPYKEYLQSHKPEAFIVSIVILQKIFQKNLILIFDLERFGADQATLIFLAISQSFFIFSNFISFIRSTRIYNLKKLNPSLTFFASFATIIFIGTLLLSLPKSQNVSIPFLDLVFTVISATCVTGLSTIDIGTSLTFTGQIVLLFLIQVGGLGLITLTTFFSIFLAGKASVTDKLMMKDLLSEDALGKVGKLIRDITYQTLVIETIGAIFLFLSFPLDSGLSVKRKVFYSIFHSVSAFCNAGFSLFPNNLSESFLWNERRFLLIIMILVFSGGIGFSVLAQLREKVLNQSRSIYKLNVSTRLALYTSFLLLVLGSVMYFLLEQKNSLNGLPLSQKIFQSVFFSVTTRTAGFNTLDMGTLGVPVVFFSLFLMWVGASPNSTGGGIKTTTFAVAILQIIDFTRGKDRLEVFKREISQVSVYRASTTIVLSLFVIFFAIFIMISVEPFSFLDVCFEVVSAYGTVGLSRGITAQMGSISKITICFVMFMGRVGVLTILIALIPKKDKLKYSYPTEYVVVG